MNRVGLMLVIAALLILTSPVMVGGASAQTVTVSLTPEISKGGTVVKYNLTVKSDQAVIERIVITVPQSLNGYALYLVDDTTLRVTNPASGWAAKLAAVDGRGYPTKIEIYNESGTSASVVSIEFEAATPTSEGRYTWIIESYDATSLIATNYSDTIVDNTPPTIELVAPEDGFITNKTTVTFNFTADDNVSSSLKYELVVDGVVKDGSATAGEYTTVQVKLDKGTYKCVWNVTVYDDAGNSNTSESRTLIVDTVPPEAVISSPQSDSFVKGIIQIKGTAKDDYFVKYNITITNATGYVVFTNESMTPVVNGVLDKWDTTGLPDGEYTITLTVYDKAGNINTTVVTVKVDNNLPTAEITSPKEGELVSGTVQINGTAYDGNFDKYNITITNETGHVVFTYENKTPVVNGVLVAEWDTTTENDGVYTITLTVYDEAGNKNIATVNITVDNTPPTAPANLTAEALPGAIKLTWESANDNYGVAYYKIYRGTQAGVNPSDNTTYDKVYITTETSFLDFNGTPGVTYYYVVTAVDRAGNEGPKSNEVNVTFIKGIPKTILLIDAPSEITVNNSKIGRAHV